MVENNEVKKTSENLQSTNAEENKDSGIQSSADSLIERARQEREGLKAENERFERNLKRMEELTAQQMLSGTGGIRTDITAKKETPKEYADRVMNWRPIKAYGDK